MKLSTYLGTKEPEFSPFNQPSNLFEAKPTTGEVVGAFVQDTFQGEGSLSQDLAASNIRRSEARDTAILEDDWKTGDNFREGLTYHSTMTEKSAKILAEVQDDRENRQIIMEKATRLQTAAGFGVGFISGIAEPKNLVSGIAVGLATAGTGVLIPSLGRMIRVNSIGAAAGRGIAEGVAGSLLTEPFSLESSKVVQGDYTMADSILNLAIGSVIGGGFSAGAKALELRGRGKKLEAIQARRAERADVGIKEFDTALSQLAQGSDVNVASVKAFDNAEVSRKATESLPRIKEQIAAKEFELGIKPIANEAFQYSKVINKDNQLQTVFHATDRTFDKFNKNENGIYFTDTPAVAQESGRNIKTSNLDMKNPHIVDFKSNKGGADIANEVQFAKENGYDGVIAHNVSEGGATPSHSQYVVFKPEQVQSKYSRDLDINEAQELYKLQSRKGQAEADSKLEVDNASIKKLTDSASRPDNSTAYDIKDSEFVDKYLDDYQDLDDMAAIEAESELLMENIMLMKEQGLLMDAELKILENLNEVLQDSAVFDNVLLHAKLCLTGR